MSLKIRRGTDAERAITPLDLGEIVFTTDTKQLYVGNGIDAGGNPIIRLGTGLAWADAQCSTIIATGAALQVSADTNPSLGGNLNLSGHNIYGTGTITGTSFSSGETTFISSSITSTNIFQLGTITTPLTLNLNLNNNLQIRQITNGGSSGYISSTLSRGTFTSPAAVQPEDELGGLILKGYTSGSTIGIGGIISVFVDPTAVIAGGSYVKSIIAIAASTDTSQDSANALLLDSTGTVTVPTVSVGDGSASHPSIVFTTDGGVDSGFFHPGDGIVCTSINAVEKVRVDSGGMRVVGFMKVGGFATGSLPNPPEAGMIALDTSTNEFKGYNGTAWVVLG